jgi:lysophospholipase L1-like esterase
MVLCQQLRLSPLRTATWGDSLTAGNEDGTGTTYPNVLASLTGYSIYNGGVGGETSSQIATRMLADTAKYSWPTIIWAGRNDYSSASTVEANIASMVAALGANQNYLILSILNDSTTPSGGAGYNQIIAINSYLAATYGSHYLDVRAYLVSQYNPSLSQDVTDHTNDVPPTSLRTDSVHPNAFGYTLLARYISQNLSALRTSTNTILRPSDIPQLYVQPVLFVPTIRANATTTSVTGTIPLALTVKDNGASNFAGIDFNTDSSFTSNPMARIVAQKTAVGSYLQFGTSFSYNSGVTSVGLSVNPWGNIGIGTTTAQNASALDIEQFSTTAYNAAATDAQSTTAPSLVIANTQSANTVFSQIVFRQRSSSQGQVRLVASGGPSPFFAIAGGPVSGTNNEWLRITNTGAVTKRSSTIVVRIAVFHRSAPPSTRLVLLRSMRSRSSLRFSPSLSSTTTMHRAPFATASLRKTPPPSIPTSPRMAPMDRSRA